MFTDRFTFRRQGRAQATFSLFAPALAGLLLGGACLTTLPARAQSDAPAVTTPAKPASAANTAAAKAPASTRPLWSELSASQQNALAPLAPHWNVLHVAQKRKWIALSRNFDKMTPDEQAVLHSRMTEWATLTAQQRTRARLNYAEVKRLAPEDERKAKWEAYQALSDDEKRKLAERAGTRPPSAAAAVRPVPSQKLAPMPSAAAGSQYAPRIELAPSSSASSFQAQPQQSKPTAADAKP